MFRLVNAAAEKLRVGISILASLKSGQSNT